jgi:hypothetical protein
MWGEVLLSIAVPGRPRYGVRVKGSIPSPKLRLEWWDIPVDVDPKNPRKVKIRWEEVAGIEAVTPLLHEASERLQERLSTPPALNLDAYKGLVATIPDPAARAQAERQLAQGLRLAAGKAADPLQELQRLGELHAAGQLTDAEFAEAEGAATRGALMGFLKRRKQENGRSRGRSARSGGATASWPSS